jgi:hypothetical protein
MQTKLTLRLEAELIERAKAYALDRRTSVSQMVADYFALLNREEQDESLAPLTRSLRGVLRGMDVDEDEYHRHLENKYL